MWLLIPFNDSDRRNSMRTTITTAIKWQQRRSQCCKQKFNCYRNDERTHKKKFAHINSTQIYKCVCVDDRYFRHINIVRLSGVGQCLWFGDCRFFFLVYFFVLFHKFRINSENSLFWAIRMNHIRCTFTLHIDAHILSALVMHVWRWSNPRSTHKNSRCSFAPLNSDIFASLSFFVAQKLICIQLHLHKKKQFIRYVNSTRSTRARFTRKYLCTRKHDIGKKEKNFIATVCVLEFSKNNFWRKKLEAKTWLKSRIVATLNDAKNKKKRRYVDDINIGSSTTTTATMNQPKYLND